MLTPKENFLQALKTGKPEYMMSTWDASEGMWGDPFLVDPLSSLESPAYMPGTEAVDAWGVRWIYEEDALGAHPSYEEQDKVITDIKKWREQITIPEKFDVDWTETLEFVDGVDRNEKMIVSFLFPGILERFVTLIGLEEAFFAMFDEPEEVGKLLDVICDVKIAMFDETYAHVKPDMIEAHDDWGNQNALTMSAPMWREFIKPRVKRFYDHVRSKGVIISHHSDCYTEPLVDDMIELGISIWQGTTPANNIPEIKKHVKGKLVIMGGIDALVVDALDATEEQIRSEVKRAIKEYAPGGYYIPCVTCEVALIPGVQEIVDDELRKTDVSVFD